MKYLFLIVVAVFMNLLCYAKNLGTYGSTYVIAEPDILEVIERKLDNYDRSGELEEFKNKYSEEVKRQIKSPHRVTGIENAKQNRIRKFDPSTVLDEDIIVPKNNNVKDLEKIEHEVLYKAGTKINPLEHMLFNESLIFIDGEIDAQREFANSYQDKNPLTKIILIDGKPGIQKIGDKEYYYYFDQWGAYSTKFNIVVVPSIVYQLNNEKVLTIEEVSLRNEETIN